MKKAKNTEPLLDSKLLLIQSYIGTHRLDMKKRTFRPLKLSTLYITF